MKHFIALVLYHFGDLVSRLPWYPCWLYSKPMIWSWELDKEKRIWEGKMTGPVTCADCGMPYADFPLDVVIPDDQWRAIGFEHGGGILCAGCIVRRGSKLPGVAVAKLRFEP